MVHKITSADDVDSLDDTATAHNVYTKNGPDTEPVRRYSSKSKLLTLDAVKRAREDFPGQDVFVISIWVGADEAYAPHDCLGTRFYSNAA